MISNGDGKRPWLHAVESTRRLGFHSLALQSEPHAAGLYRAMGAVWVSYGWGEPPRQRRQIASRRLCASALMKMRCYRRHHARAFGKRESMYHLLGIESSAGALYSGTEAAPQAYRDAQLVEKVRARGGEVADDGITRSQAICHVIARHPFAIGPRLASCGKPLPNG
jgi:hypothetical protein